MAKKIERSIRMSQVVSNYGIGALYDILGESLVLTDTKKWLENSHYGKGKEIKAVRLLESLRGSAAYHNVKALNEPVRKTDTGSLPFMRFPRWLFCSKCRRMKFWSFTDEVEGESPACQYCQKKPKLTPMRFITICEKGHMSDVDWGRWAHSQQTSELQKTCQSKEFEFVTGASKTGGLGSIAVRCRSCGSGRNLEGITAPNVLRSVGVKCSGKQPWQTGQNAVDCDSRIHVVQRGAGNVYYPQTTSALTIPPESRYTESAASGFELAIKDHALFSYLGDKDNHVFYNHVVAEIAKDVGCSVEEVIRMSCKETDGEPEESETDIFAEEWNALCNEIRETDDRDKFVTRHISLPDTQNIRQCLGKLVSVIKLREVRVLTGFFRYHPGGMEAGSSLSPVRPDIDGSLTWLPAVEAFGEGIFFTLNEEKLRNWEKQDSVRQRVAVLAARTGNSSLEYFLPEATPRFVLLHTLAHLLIRRLAFECGYSSASLRERIYSRSTPDAKDGKAGILIYTAAGDSEGTLGGLARQADGDRFTETLLSALQDACNCSADPICLESKGQGLDTLNLAACHACTLVSETSCTSFNLLLDRALVTGDVGINGFFEDLLTSVLISTVNPKAI